MESDRAQLSALATSLDDLTRRIAEIAARHRTSPREDVAHGADRKRAESEPDSPAAGDARSSRGPFTAAYDGRTTAGHDEGFW